MKLNLQGGYVKKKIAEGYSPNSDYIQHLRLIEHGVISNIFGGMHGFAGWAFSAAKSNYAKEYAEIKKEICCE